jgi:asparagine synthase (glutamine-hydrolysing)
MCGIVGVIALNKQSINVDIVKSMVDVIEHRGPDDSGFLFFHTGARHNIDISFFLNLTEEKFKNLNDNLEVLESTSIQKELHEHDYDLFFGYRRLSILDLSKNGHQPMSDLSKNIWIIFNGEIYNYLELKKELVKKGHKFKSNTDTEVILYSYIQWGISCIEKFNGMFAFAIYDNFKKKLYICRDRYGIKPLYWTLNEDLIFSSEIKSILKYESYKFQIDKEALLEYFSFQNFLTNKTLYKDIYILEQGHYLELDLNEKILKKIKYWEPKIFEYIEYESEKNSFEKYYNELESILRKAVANHLISDVEIGSFLSGGIDTGIIVKIASEYVKNLKTFTIGFDLTSVSGLELSFDERKIAEYVSYLAKTEHYEMVLKAGDMERCFKDLVYHLEEPRVGQSYPNFYAYKLASKFVKVALSGTGGDEIFLGYPWRYLPISHNPQNFLDNYYKYWQRIFKEEEMIHIFPALKSEIKNFFLKDIFYCVIKDYKSLVKDSISAITVALYFELKTFLHGLLILEDKLSMAHSLETRVPILDNDLVEFSFKIPINYKIKFNNKKIIGNTSNSEKEIFNKQRYTNGKYILRKLAEKILRENISKIPKQGFSPPDNSWFRGESINFLKNKILNKKARIYEFMDREKIYNIVNEQLEGKKNHRLLIWSLLYFEHWLEIFAN